MKTIAGDLVSEDLILYERKCDVGIILLADIEIPMELLSIQVQGHCTILY